MENIENLETPDSIIENKKQNRGFRTVDIAYMAVCIALIIVGGKIRIPTPLIPVTMQMFFCMVAGVLLGGIKGSLCVFIYIMMGLIGLPVFATGAGFSYVLMPSFGYLMGMVFAAMFIGFLTTYIEKIKKFNFKWLLLISVGGVIIVYIFGLIYMDLILRLYKGTPMAFKTLIKTGWALFIPTDTIWCFLTAFIGFKIKPRIIKIK